jgi:hypothetical protein
MQLQGLIFLIRGVKKHKRTYADTAQCQDETACAAETGEYALAALSHCRRAGVSSKKKYKRT